MDIKNLYKNFKIISGAFFRKKKYDNIIPLGYNCETAYRFYRHFRFIESSLFSWVYISSFQMLENALNNIDIIASDDFVYENTMYKCSKSGIKFHGRMREEEFTNDEEKNKILMEQDKEELRSRINYLKEKFVRTANDGKKNLYIKKISLSEANDENSYENMYKIYKFLQKFCKNDFDLLFVTEKNYFDKFIYNEKNIYTKCVEKYSPDNLVTDKKQGDKFGWDVIYTEFSPKKRVWKKKKLKFENVN